jgi:putative ABC transport system permease protein
MTAVLERPAPAPSRPDSGGAPARRAVARWSWRLFRREWRQHLLVLILLTVAVAATVGGLAVATNTLAPAATTFSMAGSSSNLTSDLATFHHAFPTDDVFEHRQLRVPGLANPVDLRAQHTAGSSPTLRLASGRLPSGGDEVAMTRGLAGLLGLHLGSTWDATGPSRKVVGLVENPTDLNDDFALVAPGQVDPVDRVSVRVPASARADSFRLTSGTSLDIQSEPASARAGAAVGVLVIGVLGMLFVGLMAVAGFTVMAHRRLRALGMLASIGATNRHVRLVMLVDGLAVGATAAVVGALVGVSGWLAFAPDLESIAGHRIDRFALPWWAIGTAMVLAMLTAVAAAWWPARTVARVPVVAALSGRPPRPRPPRRFAVAGVVIGAAGLGLLAGANERNLFCILVGIPATVIGVLLLAPVMLAGLARIGRGLPLAPRLAVRDLARHQARSGAALGAVALALGLAAVITITATDAQAISARQPGNLPTDEMVVYLSPYGANGPAPQASTAEVDAGQRQVQAIAKVIGAKDVVPLAVAVSNRPTPSGPGPSASSSGADGPPPASLVRVSHVARGFSEELVGLLYVATPQVLAAYGIEPSSIAANTDILSSRTDLHGVKFDTDPVYANIVTPVIQRVHLPRYGSDPSSLITTGAMDRHHLETRNSAWLVRMPRALTESQRAQARRMAAQANLIVETRDLKASLTQLRTDATAVGVLMALGVLAMTVGLVRSEAANDLRILAATGASSTTRRSLTGATAGLLALLGALSGTAAAYLAMAAWYHRDLRHLSHVPVLELAVILLGLPLVAAAGGWVLAGRQPTGMARRPLD